MLQHQKSRNTDFSASRPLKNQKGVAILMAMFFVFTMSFLAMSVSYETIVDYNVSAQKVNRLKAYYAAKAGMEISLLRVLLYKKAVATASSAGANSPVTASMLDPIWNFPFAWPPSGFIPEDANVTIVTKSQIKDAEKDSMMDAQYITSIESEEGKIDINDLGSSSKGLRDATKKQILQIFDLENENNEEFRDKFEDYDFEKLVNNMIDWVDSDKQSLNGGAESDVYQDLLKNYPDTNADFIPPNQAFKRLDELHMVATMKDEFVKLLKPKITVFGAKGININYATKDVLKVIDKQMTDEVLTEVLKRRDNPQEGGPFADEKDFLSFLDGQGVDTQNFNIDGVPLFFNSPFNFRITSTASFAKSTREITTITYDFEHLKERFVKTLEDEDAKNKAGKEDPPPDPKDPPPKKAVKKTIPKGRPNVVYWEED